MIHKVKHDYQEEIIIPISAIESNCNFVFDSEPVLQFNDGKEAKVIQQREIHVLSQDFHTELQRIYGKRKDIPPYAYLQKWYKLLEGRMDSMRFLLITSR